MSGRPGVILGTGMVTPVGLNAPSACAAIRAGIMGFDETLFLEKGGEGAPLIGAGVPLGDTAFGARRLADLAVPAIKESLQAAGLTSAKEVPVLLGVPEEGAPSVAGRCAAELLPLLAEELGHALHPLSRLVPGGRSSFASAFLAARGLLSPKNPTKFLLAAVDSFLELEVLRHYEKAERLKTSANSNGFIPGEAAAALVIDFAPKEIRPNSACLLGGAVAKESVTVESDEPFRADGMVRAIGDGLRDAGVTFADVHFRLSDVNGEQYGFREAALAMNRLLRVRKESFELWHCSDSFGETGAAAGHCLVAYGASAIAKGYAPGPRALVLLSADRGDRAALVLARDEREKP